MSENIQYNPHAQDKRIFLLVLLAGILAMFGGAFWYQNAHPGHLTEVTEVRGAGQRGNTAQSEGQTGMPGLTTAMSQDEMAHIAENMGKLQSDPNNPALLLDLGEHFLQSGNFDKAELFLERGSKAAPDNAKIWHLLGLAQYRLEKYDQAALSFEELIKYDKSGPNLYSLAVLYKYFLSQPEKAKVLFNQALALPGLDDKLKGKIKEEM